MVCACGWRGPREFLPESVERYRGKVEELGAVGDLTAMTEWIRAIPFEAWPQQNRLPDGQIRPAMVNDLRWHGFGNYAAEVIDALRLYVPAALCRVTNPMLSVVMPGAAIEPHHDRQPPDWLFRVHVPLICDDGSQFIVEGEPFRMRQWMAYRVNTEREHEVRNTGSVPRIHFMFDVMRGP